MLLIIGFCFERRAFTLNTPTKRYNELSYMNVVFTILVIFVHILSEPVTRLDRSSLQYFCVFAPSRLFQFVTQGFVFLSGIKLFLKKRGKLDIGRFYWGRARRVLIPYIIWTVIYYLYFVKFYGYVYSPGDLVNYILHGDVSAQFYFVILIIQFYLLTPIFMWIFKKCSPVLSLVYSLFVTILCSESLPTIVNIISPGTLLKYNDRLFTSYLFYFIAGAVVAMNYERIKSALIKVKYQVYFTGALFSAVTLYLTYTASKNGVYYGFEYYLIFAYCVSMILVFFTFFSDFAQKHTKLGPLIKFSDKSSFMLYLSHVLVLCIVRLELDKRAVNGIGIRLAITVAFILLYVAVSVIFWEGIKRGLGKLVHVYKFHARKK